MSEVKNGERERVDNIMRWPNHDRPKTKGYTKRFQPRDLSVSNYSPDAPEEKPRPKISPGEVLFLDDMEGIVQWDFFYHSKRNIEITKTVNKRVKTHRVVDIDSAGSLIYFLLYRKPQPGYSVFKVISGCHWAWLQKRNGEFSSAVRYRRKMMMKKSKNDPLGL